MIIVVILILAIIGGLIDSMWSIAAIERAATETVKRTQKSMKPSTKRLLFVLFLCLVVLTMTVAPAFSQDYGCTGIDPCPQATSNDGLTVYQQVYIWWLWFIYG